jgi:hypothetical protein
MGRWRKAEYRKRRGFCRARGTGTLPVWCLCTSAHVLPESAEALRDDPLGEEVVEVPSLWEGDQQQHERPPANTQWRETTQV